MSHPTGATHWTNCMKCGEPAFYTRRRIMPGDPITARDVVWYKDYRPVDGDLIRCMSCGRFPFIEGTYAVAPEQEVVDEKA